MPACPSTPPSFSAQVNPIIQEWCANCHAPGGTEAARPYTTYDEVKSAPPISMATQVLSCLMPPAGYPLLADADKQVLLEWVACGAPNN
jgi:hypothetical protein